jgi:hypothetical protein
VGPYPSQDCRGSFPPGLCRLKSVRRPPAQAGPARRRGQPDVPPTRAYAERRRAEDKTTKEIHRCIKRYLGRHLYRAQPRLTNTRLTNMSVIGSCWSPSGSRLDPTGERSKRMMTCTSTMRTASGWAGVGCPRV